ncbi:hypothetical protein PaeBR_15685 [Paenibacillus sp. BR2-3]|uniref:hypothetical protein n=1 Tax=Paenibacillus sp. BR2-3 TaxID=3048494 RepID=UPI003977DEBF
MFHIISLIIPIAVLLPNLLFFGIPPKNMPAKLEDKESSIFKIAEGLGRLGVFILPIFSSIHIDKPYEVLSLIGMFIFLLLYYVGWIRYFRRDREYKLLFSPMIGIPVPLAVSPVLYFLCASIVLHSSLLFLSSLILAFGHIPMSLNTYRQINKDNI